MYTFGSDGSSSSRESFESPSPLPSRQQRQHDDESEGGWDDSDSRSSDGHDDDDDHRVGASSEDESFEETPQFSILNVIAAKKRQEPDSESSGSESAASSSQQQKNNGKAAPSRRSGKNDPTASPVQKKMLQQQQTIQTQFKRYDEESSQSHSSYSYYSEEELDPPPQKAAPRDDSYSSGSYSSYSDDPPDDPPPPPPPRTNKNVDEESYSGSSYTGSYTDEEEPPKPKGTAAAKQQQQRARQDDSYSSGSSYTGSYTGSYTDEEEQKAPPKKQPPGKAPAKQQKQDDSYSSSGSSYTGSYTDEEEQAPPKKAPPAKKAPAKQTKQQQQQRDDSYSSSGSSGSSEDRSDGRLTSASSHTPRIDNRKQDNKTKKTDKPQKDEWLEADFEEEEDAPAAAAPPPPQVEDGSSSTSYEEVLLESTTSFEEVPLAPESDAAKPAAATTAAARRNVSRSQSEYTEESVSTEEESMELFDEDLPGKEQSYDGMASFHTSPEVHAPVEVIFEGEDEDAEDDTTTREGQDDEGEEKEEEEEEDDDEDEYEDDDYEDGEEDDEDGSEESPEAADPLTDHLREEKAKAPKRDNELDPPSLPLEVDMNESQSPDSSLEDGTDGKKPGWFGRGGRNKKQKENTSLLESHGESSSHGSPKESQPSGGQEKKGGFFSGWGFGRKNKQKQEEEKSADYEDDEVSEEEAEPLFEAMFDNDAPVSPGGDSRLEEMFVTQKNGDGQGKRKVAASHGKNSADSLDGVSDEVDEAIFAEDDDHYQDEYDQRRHGEVEHDRGPPGFERKPSRKQKKKKKKKGGDAPMMVSGLKDDEFEDEVMDQSADDSEHLRERMALHATKQSKAERGARSRVGGSFDDDDDYEFVKKNDAIYDEELGMPPRSRVTMTDAVYREDEGLIRDNRNRVYCMLLICCCLCIMMIGASFGAAYFAIELFEDDDEAITAAPVAPRTINITTAPTTSPPTTAPTVPSPTAAPIIPDAVANNTPRCPNGNVPLEIVVTFDGEPEEVGLQLRDSSQVAVWGFATGTFRSFSQFLRENYFMVCVSPVVTYQLEVTDSEGTGLISELIGQPVYGKFSIFYNEALVSRYNGDCASTEEGITDCGPFCSCEFILSEGLADGGCTNQCSSNQ